MTDTLDKKGREAESPTAQVYGRNEIGNPLFIGVFALLLDDLRLDIAGTGAKHYGNAVHNLCSVSPSPCIQGGV